MPKRNKIASVAVPTVKQEEDDEKGFSLPVQLTKKQCVDSFVENVNDSADKNGVFWYKHATCAICMDPIDKPSSGVVLDCKHHPFHASCIVKSLQRDRRCPVCRHAPTSRADESIQELAEMAVRFRFSPSPPRMMASILTTKMTSTSTTRSSSRLASSSDWTWRRGTTV